MWQMPQSFLNLHSHLFQEVLSVIDHLLVEDFCQPLKLSHSLCGSLALVLQESIIKKTLTHSFYVKPTHIPFKQDSLHIIFLGSVGYALLWSKLVRSWLKKTTGYKFKENISGRHTPVF